MKKINLFLQGAQIEAVKDGIKVEAYVSIEDIINQFTVKEIEENIHEYEKLFILMKNYYRKIEEREDSFFK
jgi:hypothetical protein